MGKVKNKQKIIIISVGIIAFSIIISVYILSSGFNFLKPSIRLEECKARFTSWCTSCQITDFSANLKMSDELKNCVLKYNFAKPYDACGDLDNTAKNECAPYLPTTTIVPTTLSEPIAIKIKRIEVLCVNPDESQSATEPKNNEIIIEAPELAPSDSTFSATIKLNTVNECPYNQVMNLITWTSNKKDPENISQTYSHFIDSVIQKPGYTDIKTHTYVSGEYAFYLCAFMETPSGNDIAKSRPDDDFCMSISIK